MNSCRLQVKTKHTHQTLLIHRKTSIYIICLPEASIQSQHSWAPKRVDGMSSLSLYVWVFVALTFLLLPTRSLVVVCHPRPVVALWARPLGPSAEDSPETQTHCKTSLAHSLKLQISIGFNVTMICERTSIITCNKIIHT